MCRFYQAKRNHCTGSATTTPAIVEKQMSDSAGLQTERQEAQIGNNEVSAADPTKADI
ncbi:MAG: hypothetical protein PHV24_02095 [Candidatus Kapabacteria bacterium]|nr:hypothetical protein [Candidatus Kapabacteria bacterium]